MNDSFVTSVFAGSILVPARPRLAHMDGRSPMGFLRFLVSIVGATLASTVLFSVFDILLLGQVDLKFGYLGSIEIYALFYGAIAFATTTLLAIVLKIQDRIPSRAGRIVGFAAANGCFVESYQCIVTYLMPKDAAYWPIWIPIVVTSTVPFLLGCFVFMRSK